MLPNPRGFSLIEVLVASLILTVGLTSVAWLFAFSARVVFTNEQRTVAAMLVHEKLEELKGAPLSAAVWAMGRYSEEKSGYLQMWEIRGAPVRVVEIVVYSPRTSALENRLELARAEARLAP